MSVSTTNAIRLAVDSSGSLQSCMAKSITSAYEAIAQRYAELQDQKPWNRFFERPATLPLLPDVAGLDVLDVGCGPGFYTKLMIDCGARVVALDSEALFVERTRQRTEGRASVICADVSLPLTFCADAAFDLVVSMLVLHYLEDWQPVLSEMYRVLRPGGSLFFTTHHPYTDLSLSTTGNYFATEQVEDQWEEGTVRFYRRPFSKIVTDVLNAGFVLERLDEPRPPAADEISQPTAWLDHARQKPMRLAILARKR